MSETVGSLLRNTYALINNFKLESTDPNLKFYLFLRGIDLPLYIKENNYKILDNDIISIIDTNISNIYWDNRELLSVSDLENITDYMKQSPLEFDKSEDNISGIQTYHLVNDISIIDYNTVYITIKDFIKFVNSNKSIMTKLPKVNINIEFKYEAYDFYNYSTNTIDNFISR